MAENKVVTVKDELANTFNETVAGKLTLMFVFVLIKLFTEALAVSPADTAVDESDATVLFTAEVTVAVIGADELANFANIIEAERFAVTGVDELILWFFTPSVAMVAFIGVDELAVWFFTTSVARVIVIGDEVER